MKRSLGYLAAVAILAACSGDAAGSSSTRGDTAELSIGDEPQLKATAPSPPVPAPVPGVSPTTPTEPLPTEPLPTEPLSTAPPPTAPSTTAPPTTVAGPPQTSCTSVIHLGDSTSVSLISPSFIADPGQRVDGQYRRVGALDARTEIDGALSTRETLDGQINAYDRVTRIKADGYEGCWVFALGGNDTANVSALEGGPSRVERIERMMQAIGDDPVMWVNVTTRRSSGAYRNDNMLLWNEALMEVLPRHPNMRVFDWAGVVQDDWFQDDAIHYTSDGSVLRSALIADALAAQFPA